MRGWRWCAALAALGLYLIAWPTGARAQSVGDGSKSYNMTGARMAGIYFADSTGRLLRMDANGNLKVTDAAPNRENASVAVSFTTQLSASGTGMEDSTNVFDMHDAKRATLFLYPQFDSLSTIVRVAIQYRLQFTNSADSSSAFPLYEWGGKNGTAVITDQDSTGHLTAGPTVVAQQTTTPVVWSGEREFVFNVNRQDLTGTSGTFGGYPKGIPIAIEDAHGGLPAHAYGSIRFRVINGVKSRFRLNATVYKSSL